MDQFLATKPCGHTFWCCCNKREDAVHPVGGQPPDHEAGSLHRAHLFSEPLRVGAEGAERGVDKPDVGQRQPVAGDRVLVRGTRLSTGTVIGPLTKDPEGAYVVIQFDRDPVQPIGFHKNLLVILSENS